MSPSAFVFTAAGECLREQVSLRHSPLLKSILCASPLECGGLDPDGEGQSEPGCLFLLIVPSLKRTESEGLPISFFMVRYSQRAETKEEEILHNKCPDDCQNRKAAPKKD